MDRSLKELGIENNEFESRVDLFKALKKGIKSYGNIANDSRSTHFDVVNEDGTIKEYAVFTGKKQNGKIRIESIYTYENGIEIIYLEDKTTNDLKEEQTNKEEIKIIKKIIKGLNEEIKFMEEHKNFKSFDNQDELMMIVSELVYKNYK